MSFTLISTFYTLALVTILAASLYRGSIHQKIAIALIALIVAYQAHQYQNERLFTAVKNGELIKAQQLLTWGARVNARNALGETPLIVAAGLGHLELARVLIDKGADVNAITKEFHTALHYASANGHTELVEKLLDSGAAINVQDLSGYTPLHYAVAHGPAPLVNLLVTHGARLNLKNREGLTPVDLALKATSHEDLHEVLSSQKPKAESMPTP
jgi:uncharacterized protein